MMAHDTNNPSINPLLFIVPMPDRGYSKSSRLGDTEKWNAELIDENKSLKLRLDNPFADLPEDKKARAKALDAIVERGARGYIELGRALREIKDGDYFKELGFETWEGYCIERRNIAKRYAYYLIDAYDLCTMVQSKGLPPLPTERHARELLALREDESKMLEAYETFLELDASTRTASALRGIVGGYLPSKPETVRETASEAELRLRPQVETVIPDRTISVSIPDSSVGESGSSTEQVGEAGESGLTPVCSTPIGDYPYGRPDSLPNTPALGPTPSVGESAAAPHLVVHIALDAAIEDAFAKAEAGDDKIIEDLKWAAYNINRKLKALGYEPFDWTKDEPT